MGLSELYAKLGSKIHASVLTRIVISFVIYTVAMIGINIYGTFKNLSSQVEFFQDELVQKVSAAVKSEEQNLSRVADYAAMLTRVFPRLSESLTNEDYSYASEAIGAMCTLQKLNGYVITDLEGNVLCTNYTNYTDEQLEEISELIRYALTQPNSAYSGYFDMPEQGIGNVTVHTLPDTMGYEIAAIMFCEQIIESNQMLDKFGRVLQMSISIYRDGVCTASTVTEEEYGVDIIGSNISDMAIIDTIASRRQPLDAIESESGFHYFSRYVPIIDYKDNLLGVFHASTETTVLDKMTSTMAGFMLGAAIVMIAFLLFIIFGFRATLTQPLRSLADDALHIAHGDLSKTVTKSVTDDEISLLSNALTLMHSNLSETIGSVVETAKVLHSASEELSNASMQLSDGANKQASSLEEVASSLEEMTGGIHQNSDNAITTERLIKETADTMNTIADAATESMNDTHKIAGSIKAINALVNQTTILSLNASVEAARAGSAGRGFAVVAKEVGRLAEQTKNTAIDVSNIAKKSIEGAEGINASLDEVTPQINKVVSLIKEITASSQEQRIGADQINTAVMELNKVTQETAANAEEVAANAQELAVTADKLKEIINHFKVS